MLSHSHVPSTWQKKADASVAQSMLVSLKMIKEKALAKAIEKLELTGSASDKWLSSLLLAQSSMPSLTIPWLWQKMRLLKTTVWRFFRVLWLKPKAVATFNQ